MDDGRSSIESRLEALERGMRSFELRLAAIERAAPATAEEPSPAPPNDRSTRPAAAAVQARRDVAVVGVLSVVGRMFVVLGGAYLLRALTDSQLLPPRIGVALGFAYAAWWLAAADRSAARGRTLGAVFYGLTSSIIALPLLWEAVTRFQLLDGGTASAWLTTITITVLAVAVRRRLQPLAWIVVGGALVTSIALIATTGSVLEFAVGDIVLGVVTLWIGYTVEWVWLRWPVALVADLAVLALAAGVSTHASSATPPRIIGGQLLLLTAYLGSIVVRTLVRGREVNVFEIVQSIAALAVGFGGAVYVAEATGLGATALAAVSLACGAGCYGVAFAFIARRQGLHRNFYFYTSLALVLVVVSTTRLVSEAALIWAALAVLASWAARRVGRVALALHAAVFVVAAAIASGLLRSATAALVGAPVTQSAFAPSLLVVFGAAALCWMIPIEPAADAPGRGALLPRLVIAVVLAWSAAAWIVTVVVSAAADPGVVATVRTGALALAALALAWLGRSARFPEAGWLVYPVLLAGAVKLVAEDFPRSNPATLFLALALYGGALIAAPRIVQRAG